MNSTLLVEALLGTLKETLHGEEGKAWHVGFLRTLSEMDARTASQGEPNRSTIAAHAEHVRYTLEIANAWLQGQRPVFDWTLAWQHREVSAEAWSALRNAILEQTQVLETRIRSLETWDARALQLVMQNTAHLAYHVGAIRQILVTLR
jgi:hypothetical protein